MSFGCAKPLPREIAAKVEDGKLTVMYQSPKEEVFYNRNAGILTFDKEDTKYIKNVLLEQLKEKW